MSSDRSLDSGTALALVQPHVQWFPLVKMEFDTGDVRIAGTDFPVEYPAGSGTIWTASRGLGRIEPITETGDSVEGLKFTLAGIPNSLIIEAQQEKYQGRKCTVMLAFLTAGVVLVDQTVWQGRLDVRSISVGRETSTISVTAEHCMVDWKRKRELLFNSASQKLIDPTDTFWDGIENSKRVEKVVFSKAARTI